MKNQLQKISIPDPCHMKWEEMAHVDENRRHCSSCKKVIVDFTKMSDAELISFFGVNPHACGKFTAQQLNRDLKADKIITRNGAWKSAFLLSSLLMSIQAFAYDKSGGSESKTNFTFIESAANSIPGIPANAANDSLLITGTVLDSITHKPVALAGILVMDSLHTVYGGTDSTGHFTLKFPYPQANHPVHLIIEQAGYATVVKNIDPAQPSLTVQLQKQEIILLEEIRITEEKHYTGIPAQTYVDYTPRSKVRRFFRRLFHPRSWSR